VSLSTLSPNPPDAPVSGRSVSPVVLKDVVHHFGRFAALRGVNAEFEAARLYVIVGDNGAGKSTLLRTIAGLIKPTRGAVTLLGTTELRSVTHEIGYMAHAPLLYDELDAMENLLYFARLYDITDRRKCEEAIASVGLDPTLTRRVGQYSQGMRQRLSLARAILNEPKVLLLDEPFSNVDIVSAREMVQLLGKMRDAGRTIFVVTHQPALLETVADEFVLMTQGLITDRRPEVAVPEASVRVR
jgi:ABC-type multidrug transport system ATPase subunit